MARLVLTAPRPRVLAVATALRDDGHEVLELPFVEIESLADEPAQRAVLADAASSAVTATGSSAASGRSARVGHAARCTDPVCHHDQTSSVTNGRNGANSRRMTDNAAVAADTADAAAASSPARRRFTSSM